MFMEKKHANKNSNLQSVLSMVLTGRGHVSELRMHLASVHVSFVQSVVLNTSGSWNLNLVTNASNPLVRRLPEMKLDVTPAKRLYLSSQPQNLIIKSSASEKPLPVYVSPAAISERDLDRLSVSLNPPRALAVSISPFPFQGLTGIVV